jgi:hypothetical protein
MKKWFGCLYIRVSYISPIVGTNLGKVNVCGARVSFFDVGGKLQDLWERYYDDADAVIFCWKLGENENDDKSQDSDAFAHEQHALLLQVRKAIGDDVPFLILGHVFGGPVNDEWAEQMYTTSDLLPHYHNPVTGLGVASATSGAGIAHALQWLIPLAKRAQKERLASAVEKEKKRAPKHV